MTYTARTARLRANSLQRRKATDRARFERQNAGPIGAAFARVCDFLFTMPGA